MALNSRSTSTERNIHRNIQKIYSLVSYKVRWTLITNCDSFFITKCNTGFYKLRQVLRSTMDLLQVAKGITKCDDYYKLGHYTLEDMFTPTKVALSLFCDSRLSRKTNVA